MENNTILVEEGSEWAHAERNRQLEEMRKRSSPLGRYVVRIPIEEEGPKYHEILERKARREFGMRFNDLIPEKKRAVSN